MKFKELIKEIEKACPLEIQEEWDNCGIQIYTGAEEVDKVLVALEITSETIDEAIELGADLIITHHPLFFTGQKTMDVNTYVGKLANKLISHNISVYSCHTNFDAIFGGNNDFLGTVLAVDMVVAKYPDNKGILRHGWYNDPKRLGDLVDVFSFKLGVDKSFFQLVGDPDRMISKVAICTGAGADFIEEVVADRCDLLITGDVKYHDARKAKELGLAVVDLGHYASEMIFSEAFLCMMLASDVDENLFILSQKDINPFTRI
ncbi:MAG: Nif3-like dinuclear metal center hexameric protein [Clostridia bacterium]|nr:Nif3-like dinuclear metal center hexameric protein [Clostridia bacterium]